MMITFFPSTRAITANGIKRRLPNQQKTQSAQNTNRKPSRIFTMVLQFVSLTEYFKRRVSISARINDGSETYGRRTRNCLCLLLLIIASLRKYGHPLLPTAAVTDGPTAPGM